MKRKKIDSDPVFDEKCLRTNIKSGSKKSPEILKMVRISHLKKDLCAFVYNSD